MLRKRSQIGSLLQYASLIMGVALLTCQNGVRAEVAELEKKWKLRGIPTENKVNMNISGIAITGDRSLLVVGSDEQSNIQILAEQEKGEYKLVENGNFALANMETELDIEGIARDGETYWVIGSHSMKRKLIKTVKELEEEQEIRKSDGDELSENYNHKRIETVALEPTRDWLYRLKINSQGEVDQDSIMRVSLRNIFANHPVLSRFSNIPSKENGIDIEGLAVVSSHNDSRKTKLLVGLRGPTLRGPRAVVLVIKVEEEESDRGEPILDVKLKKTRYLALKGRGIRGISEMDNEEDGYLLLAGPVGDEPTSYQLYRWNGKDTIPEINDQHAEGNVEKVCIIPPPAEHPKAKAEGIEFLKQQSGKVHFVVVYDSGKNGAATVFSCKL